VWDPALRNALGLGARDAKIELEHGVYAAGLGPSYETPAEIGWLASLGVDAVGMSTVLEALAARASGLRVCGVSLITNPASGLSAKPLAHEEVVAEGERASRRFALLFERSIPHFLAALAR
jgi:purine-nucleoside phosphorylase